jgi:hypothetical protein
LQFGMRRHARTRQRERRLIRARDE